MDKFVGNIAKAMALVGGFILLALVIMTCISIIGRSLVFIGLGPIQGDYDLTEMGIAVAIFAFLPWCQFSRSHASVELFTASYNAGFNRILDLLFDALMTFMALIIAWRLYAGLLNKKDYGETTFILGAPIWYAYAACMVGACVFVLVSLYCLFRSGKALVKSTPTTGAKA